MHDAGGEWHKQDDEDFVVVKYPEFRRLQEVETKYNKEFSKQKKNSKLCC